MTQVTDPQRTLVLGRYRLLDQVAMGGTARVHRARDEQLDRAVAVKLLHPHLLPDDTSRRRLAAEARAAAVLSHPGIATVYDVDTDPEAPAIVMELVDGEPLSTRLAQGPMEPREVARLGAEVADALYHAHRRGIVHRDVKPGNILLERGSGRARLIDFGIAHSLAAGAESLTQTGTALGTPRYMAPEQMAGGKVGPRTDLWSLGAVLYQALTGRVPFDGPTPVAIANQQRGGPPPMDGVDLTLAGIVAACLSPEVEGRPIDAAALAKSLRAWLAGETVAATSAVTVQMPAVAAAGDAVPASGAQAAVPVEPASGRRRSVTRILVLGSLAIIGLALAGVMLPNLSAEVPSASATPRQTPASAPTDEEPTWFVALQEAYLQACGEPLPSEELKEERKREEIEKKVNEEISKCLEEADRDEGEGGGPPPKDDGRGNGNEGNQGHGNGGGDGDG